MGEKKDLVQHLLNLSVQCGTKHMFTSFCCKDLYVYLYIVVNVVCILNSTVMSILRHGNKIMPGKVVQVVFSHTWRFIHTWFSSVMGFFFF